MNMKSLKTQFIGAIAMVLVAAIAMGSSTYAWFALNNKVTVTGMTVKTVVGDNLLIAPTTNSQTGDMTATMPGSSDYRTQIISTTSDGILEPVSSVSGLNDTFYYASTDNVDSNGEVVAKTYYEYWTTGVGTTGVNTTNYTNAFSQNYGVKKTNTAVAFVDYVFALQATNTSGKDKLNLTKCDLTYNGTDDTTENAFRAAIIVQEASASAAETTSGSPATKTILAPTSAVYFTDGKAINNTSGVANGSVTAVLNQGATIGTVALGNTNYYKVTVRLWLEGEDNTCKNSTFATLKNEWDLDLKFELEDSTLNAVTALGRPSKGNYDFSSAAPTYTSASNMIIGNTTYYAYSGTPSGASEAITIYADNATLASVLHWYTITAPEVYEITEFVKLPTT